MPIHNNLIFNSVASRFEILKNEEGYCSSLQQQILTKVLSEQAEKVKELVEKKPDTIFQVKFNTIFAELIESILELYDTDPQLSSGVEKRSGLSKQEQLKCFEIAKMFSKTILDNLVKEKKNIISKKDIDEKIKDWSKFSNLQLNQLWYHFGKTREEPIRIEEYDLVQLKIDEKLEEYIGKLDCAEFVFLKLDDEKIICEYLNKKKHLPEDFFQGNHSSYFSNWGYKKTLNPTKNDIIVYLNDQNTPSLRAMHFAIYLENGEVLSKKGGVYNPKIYKHDITSVPLQYGRFIEFYRKTKS
ncbi:MAG: hypothetical protein L0207_00405 [Chlamydiae bacterium]|nr:hypothetical protein [Chlamydiota bacterium]